VNHFECSRCGVLNHKTVVACASCDWPLQLDAWKSSRHQLRRLSLDTSCVNAKQANPQINLLERWAVEGRVVLERSNVFLQELKGHSRQAKAALIPPHPAVWKLGIPGQSELGITTMLGGADVGDEVKTVMFPTTTTVNRNQMADVDHIRDHVMTGSHAFVTLNVNDFTRHGKQADLRRRGIWVFTPLEVTQLLVELYSWDA